ncbi:MAG: serine hydrolase domain-containing protein [Gaiellaceae bacterium]
MGTTTTSEGTVAAGFEPVRDAFEENFRRRNDVGAAFSAYVDGTKVVDIWGGDAAPDRPWDEQTIVLAFSVAKGITAFVMQLLAERGELDISKPVSHYWPEFAKNGKDAVTVQHVLTHTAGVPIVPDYWDWISLDRPEAYLDLPRIVQGLEDAPLQWEPGSQFAYHSTTYGWILGEVVRRITGKTLGEYLQAEVAAPLGLEMWIGTPEAVHARVATLIPDPAYDSDEFYAHLAPDLPGGQTAFLGRERRFGQAVLHAYNDPRMWRAESPAGNGIMNARSLARLYALLANGGELDGVRLLSPATIEDWGTVRVDQNDLYDGRDFRVALGYISSSSWYRMGLGPRTFGDPGMGGAVGYADPDVGLGFAFTPNRMVFSPGRTDPRVDALSEAIYACL